MGARPDPEAKVDSLVIQRPDEGLTLEFSKLPGSDGARVRASAVVLSSYEMKLSLSLSEVRRLQNWLRLTCREDMI